MVTRVPSRMITTTGVTAGSYTAADITVNSSGQITGANSNSVVASGGGGPKITTIVVTDSSYNNLDDTAVDTSGGYIKITGTGFVTGCQVLVGTTSASSVTFISATEVRAQLSATAAGTYIIYLVNPDGGTAIRVNGVTFSASPSWVTGTSQEGYQDAAISIQFSATDAITYSLQAGSSLPPGLTLSNVGLLSGTVTGLANDTLYTFTVVATDIELQDSPRTFTVNILVNDPYFKLTTLLLSGSALSANTVVRDSSTNNFNLTVYGDARASNFTPYGTGWSVYFDGTGDYLSFTNSNNQITFGTDNFTIEFYVNFTNPTTVTGELAIRNYIADPFTTDYFYLGKHASATVPGAMSFWLANYAGSLMLSDPTLPTAGWMHYAVVRNSNTWTLYRNGLAVHTVTSSVSMGTRNSNECRIGESLNGHISNLRVVKGIAVYTANFTPATTNLTSVANTSILTCHVNSFRDASTNNFAITRNGDAAIRSFNPFNITNTGVNGSAYFDGTGDVIKLPANNNFAVGTGAFCVEFWSYVISLQNYRVFFSSRPDNGGYADALHFGYDGNGGAGIYSNADLLGAPAGTIRVKEWQYIVVCRNSSNVTSIFVNGLRVGSGTVTSNFTRNLFGIGDFPTTQSEPHFGYMADFRFVKGSTPYDPTQLSITVPTQPLTAIADTQLLTLQYDQPHNNHTFLDSSSNQFLITRNGNATQGTFSPFSHTGFSLYTNGTNSYASVPYDASRSLGTGDFSIECWIQLIRQPVDYSRIFSIQGGWGVAGHYGIELSMQTIGNNMEVIIAIQGTTVYGNNVIVSPASNYLNRWNHVVITRSSGVVRTFLNGALVTAGNNTTNINGTLATTFGCSQFPGNYSEMLISNFRLVRNSVPTQYQTSSTIPGTQIFTPPTNKVTTTSQGAVAGDVKLLLWQENRFIENASNVTISAFNTPRITPFGPFSDTIYSPAIHGGSAYFDGSGDFLQIPANAAFAFGTGAFTVEAWIYPTVAQGVTLLSSNYNYSTASGNWSFYFTTSGATTLYFNAGSASGGANHASSTTVTILLNTWTHMAYTRTGSTGYFWINGVQLGTGVSDTSNYAGSSGDLYVGRQNDATSQFGGYMAGLRIVKGTAVYTASFTPPTEPVITTTNTSLLLNFTDAAILDSTGRNVLETLADAKTSSVVTKFTGASMYFDGTGDWNNMPSSPLNAMGTGDFTIECWIYPTKISTTNGIAIFSNRTDATADSTFGLLWSSSRGLYLHTYSTVIFDSGTLPTINTWQYVAYVRASGVIKIYLNGLQIGTSASFTSNLSSTIGFYVGKDGTHSGSGAEPYQGYISDLRVTRGYARYTANFTAPTAPARLK